jgi:hypothetical protein
MNDISLVLQMHAATNVGVPAALIVAGPPHRALALPKIVAAVLEHLPLYSLRPARLVCRTWAAAGFPLLWRSMTPWALACVPSTDGQRQSIAGYVRRLTVYWRGSSADDWRLPKNVYLSLPGNALQAHVALLCNCGPQLASLHIHDPHLSSSSDPYSDAISLTAEELAMLALSRPCPHAHRRNQNP